jgi:deoxycytidylate deaminase
MRGAKKNPPRQESKRGRPRPTQRRPGWDEYFMRIAHVVSSRSTCLRRLVGAVIVKDQKILSTGYNGAPSRITH